MALESPFAAYLEWQGDFLLDEGGNTLLADGDTAFVQRLIRRILTSPRYFDRRSGLPIAPPDYIFEPEFGAGLRRLVNDILSIDEVNRLVNAQVVADLETSNISRPRVEVAEDPQGSGDVFINVIVVRQPNVLIAFGVRLSA